MCTKAEKSAKQVEALTRKIGEEEKAISSRSSDGASKDVLNLYMNARYNYSSEALGTFYVTDRATWYMGDLGSYPLRAWIVLLKELIHLYLLIIKKFKILSLVMIHEC